MARSKQQSQQQNRKRRRKQQAESSSNMDRVRKRRKKQQPLASLNFVRFLQGQTHPTSSSTTEQKLPEQGEMQIDSISLKPSSNMSSGQANAPVAHAQQSSSSDFIPNLTPAQKFKQAEEELRRFQDHARKQAMNPSSLYLQAGTTPQGIPTQKRLLASYARNHHRYYSSQGN